MLPKIVITGGNGMVGSELVDKLRKKYRITVIDKLDSNITGFSEDIEICRYDFCNTERIEPCLKDAFAVIHLAAAVHWVPKSEMDKEKFAEINARATERFFYACARNNVKRVLFFSTNDVYEESDSIVGEDYSISPKSVYAKTKYDAEKFAIKVSNETGMPICIFRPASIFGKGDKGSLKTLIKLCRIGIVPVVRGGKNLKSLSYVKDISLAVDSYLGNNDPLGGQAFNIATGTYSFSRLLDAIQEVFGLKFIRISLPAWFVFKILAKLPFVNKMATAAGTKAVDYDKYSAKTGYKPVYDLDDALRDCAQYYNEI
jgi:nucleoside-diphosphate-sugar epimerase